VLERLSIPEFDPLQMVVLNETMPVQSSARLNGQASIERYENNEVMVQTTANTDAVLVLADSYYPGWKAFVDGKETKVYKANHFFRAVLAPKGNHQIVFKYEPWSFKLGVIMSSFSMAGISIVSLLLYFRQRKLSALTLVPPIQILHDQ
jgi:uncharacterized membrane protein YfhO